MSLCVLLSSFFLSVCARYSYWRCRHGDIEDIHSVQNVTSIFYASTILLTSTRYNNWRLSTVIRLRRIHIGRVERISYKERILSVTTHIFTGFSLTSYSALRIPALLSAGQLIIIHIIYIYIYIYIFCCFYMNVFVTYCSYSVMTMLLFLGNVPYLIKLHLKELRIT
jgi:hypothetical protein